MAEIKAQLVVNRQECRVYLWAHVTENDTCYPANLADKADKSFMVTGSFGGGGVSLEGTLDPEKSAWFLNTDDGGNPATLVAAGRIYIKENDLYSRPRAPTGNGANLNIWLMARG